MHTLSFITPTSAHSQSPLLIRSPTHRAEKKRNNITFVYCVPKYHLDLMLFINKINRKQRPLIVNILHQPGVHYKNPNLKTEPQATDEGCMLKPVLQLIYLITDFFRTLDFLLLI